MTQPDLFTESPDPRPVPKRGRIPATSVQAYRSRARDGRVALVLDALATCAPWPTSAELAKHINPHGGMEGLLAARRGLSDALKLGLVEQGPSRPCGVSKGKGGRPMQCLTWGVKSR